MKKHYVHLEKLSENVIKKFFVKVNLKFEIKVEELDELKNQIYNDDLSQFVFLMFEIMNFTIRILNVNLLKYTKCFSK